MHVLLSYYLFRFYSCYFFLQKIWLFNDYKSLCRFKLLFVPLTIPKAKLELLECNLIDISFENVDQYFVFDPF